MGKSKYLGKTYEGRWKVIERVYNEKGQIKGYKLENIFNKETLYVNHSRITLIDRNILTISKLRQRMAIKNGAWVWRF